MFVGRVSALVRDKLWEHVQHRAGQGAGMLIHHAQCEQGYVIRTFGETSREVVDCEGISLVRLPGKDK